MSNSFQCETLLPVLHHPEFLFLLPFGARLQCHLRLRLGLGFWGLKVSSCLPELLPYTHQNH